jgi:integrase
MANIEKYHVSRETTPENLEFLPLIAPNNSTHRYSLEQTIQNLKQATLNTIFSPSSQRLLSNCIEHFIAHASLNDLDFKGITPELLERYFFTLDKQENLAASTINSHKWALKTALLQIPDFNEQTQPNARKALLTWFKSHKNVKIELQLNENQYLDYETIQEISKYCRRPKSPLGDTTTGLVIELLFVTAARVSEVISARIRDASVLTEKIDLKIIGKGSKQRLVYIPSKLWGEIKTTFNSKYFILETSKNTAYDQASIYRKINRICKKVIQKDVHPHTLRHSAAMHLLKSGMDINALSQYLGHADVSTTLKYYVHSRPKSVDIINFLEIK